MDCIDFSFAEVLNSHGRWGSRYQIRLLTRLWDIMGTWCLRSPLLLSKPHDTLEGNYLFLLKSPPPVRPRTSRHGNSWEVAKRHGVGPSLRLTGKLWTAEFSNWPCPPRLRRVFKPKDLPPGKRGSWVLASTESKPDWRILWLDCIPTVEAVGVNDHAAGFGMHKNDPKSPDCRNRNSLAKS